MQEARSWWRVRLVAILLTIELAAFILVSFALVLVGPTVADTVAEWLHLGLVILMGAEMNAVIEHASPMGKDPGEKVPGGGTG